MASGHSLPMRCASTAARGMNPAGKTKQREGDARPPEPFMLPTASAHPQCPPNLGAGRAGGSGDVTLQRLADGQQVHLGAGFQPALHAAGPLQLPHLLLQFGEGSLPCKDSRGTAKPGYPPTPLAARAKARHPPAKGQIPSALLPMRISSPSRAPFLSGSVRVRWDWGRSLLRSSGLTFARCGLAALSRRAAAGAGVEGQRKDAQEEGQRNRGTPPCSWAPQPPSQGWGARGDPTAPLDGASSPHSPALPRALLQAPAGSADTGLLRCPGTARSKLCCCGKKPGRSPWASEWWEPVALTLGLA